MFFHCFKYYFIHLTRNRVMLFWTVMFPMFLATMFYFAFSNLYNAETVFTSVPVAVVAEDESSLKEVLTEMSDGDSPLFDARFVSADEAVKLLSSQEVQAIITDGSPIEMTVLSGESIEKSIVKCFLDQYNANYSVIEDVAASHPEKLPDVIADMSAEIDPNESANYTDGNLDVYVQFFYNLVSMTCLFAAMSGMYVSIINQANLSSSGARVSVSPARKGTLLCSSLAATTAVQYIGLLLATAYMIFVLGIDFSVPYAFIALIEFVGILVGVSMGFFVGSFGRMSEGMKRGLLLATTMTLSFFSGLMAGSMRVIVENSFPMLNRLSPVALITDSFYVLNIYDGYERFAVDMLTLAAWILLFTVGGVLLSLRKKFKSI